MTIYQIVVKAQFNQADEFRNVHHYEFPGYVPNDAELQEAVDYLDGRYKFHMQQAYPTQIRVYGYDTRRVDVPDLPTIEYLATALPWAGTNVNQALPTQCAALTTFKAPTTYPRTTRTYHFPFTEGANEIGGILSGAALFIINGWAGDVLTIPITTNQDAVKVTVRYTLTPPRVTAYNILSNSTANVRFATQRRRKIGSGA